MSKSEGHYTLASPTLNSGGRDPRPPKVYASAGEVRHCSIDKPVLLPTNQPGTFLHLLEVSTLNFSLGLIMLCVTGRYGVWCWRLSRQWVCDKMTTMMLVMMMMMMMLILAPRVNKQLTCMCYVQTPRTAEITVIHAFQQLQHSVADNSFCMYMCLHCCCLHFCVFSTRFTQTWLMLWDSDGLTQQQSNIEQYVSHIMWKFMLNLIISIIYILLLLPPPPLAPSTTKTTTTRILFVAGLGRYPKVSQRRTFEDC